MKETDDKNFETDVTNSDIPVLVDFWAPWCAPCRALGPTLDKVAQAFQGRVSVVKVNTDENQGLAERFSIRAIPTMMVFKGGEPVEHLMGAHSEGSIKEMLERVLQGKE